MDDAYRPSRWKVFCRPRAETAEAVSTPEGGLLTVLVARCICFNRGHYWILGPDEIWIDGLVYA